VADRSVDLWASFPHDPRDPAVASLRASDADREVVHGLLTEAFADGRLDRDEYDERSGATLQARTLGELPPLVADLVPDRPLMLAKVPLSAATSSDLQSRAEEKWRKDRREAFFGLVGAGIFFGALDLFIHVHWVLVPVLFALMNLVRTLGSHREIVASEVKRLERKRAKEIEARNKKKQLGP
jgi:hypothetical protein